MTLCTRMTDAETEASAALIAAEVLAHPLALQLPQGALDIAVGVVAGDVRVDAHTASLLRLILTHIDRLEIAASLGVAA